MVKTTIIKEKEMFYKMNPRKIGENHQKTGTETNRNNKKHGNNNNHKEHRNILLAISEDFLYTHMGTCCKIQEIFPLLGNYSGGRRRIMPKVIKKLREKILAEADRQMREVGYGAMTIQSIAKGCGAGVGTVYNYFSSKDEIVIACVAAAWMKRMDVIRAVSQYSQTSDAVIRCIYAQIQMFGEEHAYIFKNPTAANSVDGAIFRYMWFLSSQLAEPLRKFCKSDTEAQLIAEALLAWIRTGKSCGEVLENIMKLF